MKYSQAKQGRIFVIRLEDGDILHQEIEKLAKKENVKAATLIALGGIDKGSKLVVGPKNGRTQTIVPQEKIIENVYEISATGTIFPDEKGEPILHMHAACGRNAETITGCVRNGVKTWHVIEVIMTELIETEAKRLSEPATGFKLLKP